MRNYLCWDPSEARRVMNPFAEHIPDSLFRAIHSDWALQVSPPVGTSFQQITTASFTQMSPEDLLTDFLREDRPHALAAILGTTGSGKSHLVHWLRLNIKPHDKRVVLVVKKSGTSLRKIVEMIIDELDPAEQQGFRDTLNRAGEGTSTRDGQKQQLLNDLAFAIREDVPRNEADEYEAELIAQLPHLFQDPHMREEHFLRDGTIISDIVDHIFAASNAADRPDRRRQFSEDDLPLGGADYAHASKHAQNAIKVIDLEPSVTRPLAVELINRNLDKAIARTLSFSGDRVEELMTRLRRHLKQGGRELVLLIEEFARLQGIDRALLQAITAHGDDEQCKMRSAIAVTTGFFESVAETAYMRTTHIVDMDRSAGREEGRTVTPASLAAFASRYLNAARLGLDGVEQWNDIAMAGDHPPSKCTTCPYVGECHPAFGAVEGYGLYPFTAQTLWTMASRADHNMPESLNPRILQNNVLIEVLDTFAPTISVGEYPPHRLLEKFGPERALSLTERNRLNGINPQSGERWIAALELYDGSGKVVNLPSTIREAFSIPEIPGIEESSGTAAPMPEIRAAAADAPVRRASPEDLLIEQWVNGEGLEQTLATTLRNLIFPAVSDSIDWDMLGLERASFVGKTGRAFRPMSVNFLRQTTQVPNYLQVQLQIPGNGVDLIRAGAALQGLVRASKNGFRWDFEDGDRMLADFIDCLEVWTADVEGQLRALCNPAAGWSQTAAALQLLCVGAALSNKVKPDCSIAEMVDGAFSQWPSEAQASSAELKAVYDKLFKRREVLSELARAQISSMKGGRKGAMLSPDRYIADVRAFSKAKWKLTLEPPADERLPEFKELAKLYTDIKQALEPAVQSEWLLRSQWLTDMESSFGEGASRATILSALTAARDAAQAAGIGSGNTSRALGDQLERFQSAQFDDALSAARALAKFEDPISALPYFGRGRRNAVDAARDLRTAASSFLDAVEQNLSTYGSDQQARHAASADSIARITTALTRIEHDLNAISPTVESSADAA
jgi:hypothetical protein